MARTLMVVQKLKVFFRGSLGYGHYIFAATLLLRLFSLSRLNASPFLLPSGSDMQFYDDWAKQILHGHWSDHQAFYGLPLYPFLIALLYQIFGYSPFVPGFFQACFDAGTAVLIFNITVRVTMWRGGGPGRTAHVAGIIAATGWALFVPAEAYSAILMPTAGAVFVFWLLVWQIIRTETAPSSRRYFVYGLVLGFSSMGVATILFLVPLFLAAIFCRQTNAARSATAAVLLFIGVIAGAAPCWIHNFAVARDRVFLSAHGGINFWLGNNPQATGYPHFPGLHAGQGPMLRDSIEQAEATAGRALKRSEVSRYWSGKARDYIAANPAAWLRLLLRKTGNFWNAFEYDDVGVITNLRDHGIIFPGLHFAVVAVFGLAGIVLCWRAYPGSRWIAVAIAFQMAAILPVFVTERYRLAAVPGLLVLGLLGLRQLWTRCAEGQYKGAALQVGLIAAIAWLVSLPRHDPSLWALDAYNSGKFALEANNLTVAGQHLQRAYSLAPGNAEINFALGNLRVATDDLVAAKKFYEAALASDDKHKGALNNLGVVALTESQPGAAVDYFRRSLTLEPQNAKTHYLLAKALLADGRPTEAAAALKRAVELDGERAEFASLQEEIEKSGR
jgi:Flp pilus assembly protein TadD